MCFSWFASLSTRYCSKGVYALPSQSSPTNSAQQRVSVPLRQPSTSVANTRSHDKTLSHMRQSFVVAPYPSCPRPLRLATIRTDTDRLPVCAIGGCGFAALRWIADLLSAL